ncbi:MAG: type II toxin-antitoxin system PemK/MazF family toxin [Planctomycetes bacterium]|nr:type II toxin-antitoxin system PemK/MazF family toxin [Planctomycetota bacterium]
MKRGEVVLVDFPYTDGSASKVRPALVVQNDRDNARLRDIVVALITGNTSRSHEPTQHLVDPNMPEGASSGLHGASSVLCRHLYTVRLSLVIRTIGYLPAVEMKAIDQCLKAALGL